MGLRWLGENSGQPRCLGYRLTHDEGECFVVELVYQPQVVTLPIGHEVRRSALLAGSVRSWDQHRAGGEDTICGYLVGACQIGNFPQTAKILERSEAHRLPQRLSRSCEYGLVFGGILVLSFRGHGERSQQGDVILH